MEIFFNLHDGIYLQGMGNLKGTGSPVETYDADTHAPLSIYRGYFNAS